MEGPNTTLRQTAVLAVHWPNDHSLSITGTSQIGPYSSNQAALQVGYPFKLRKFAPNSVADPVHDPSHGLGLQGYVISNVTTEPTFDTRGLQQDPKSLDGFLTSWHIAGSHL